MNNISLSRKIPCGCIIKIITYLSGDNKEIGQILTRSKFCKKCQKIHEINLTDFRTVQNIDHSLSSKFYHYYSIDEQNVAHQDYIHRQRS